MFYYTLSTAISQLPQTQPNLFERFGQQLSPACLRTSLIFAHVELNCNFDSNSSVPEFHDTEINMLFNIRLGDSQRILPALFVLCITLFAIFAVKLFNARMHFIKLKRQGLVSSHSKALASRCFTLRNTLRRYRLCHHIIRYSVICSWPKICYPRYLQTHTLHTYPVCLDKPFPMSALSSILTCGPLVVPF